MPFSHSPAALAIHSLAAVLGRHVSQVIGMGMYRAYYDILLRPPQTFGDASSPRYSRPSVARVLNFSDHRIEFSSSFSSWVVRTTFSQISTITSSRSQLDGRPTPRLGPQLGQPV